MTYFDYFRPSIVPLTDVERTIMKGTTFGTVNYRPGYPTEIKAPLCSVAKAVETAYVLTPREALPKITATGKGLVSGSRSFSGSNGLGATVQGGTAESARQSAALWLAIAEQLEAEENEAAEAKRKADAEKAEAEHARRNRLDLIADLYFGKDFDELGDNKAIAVKEIYRLEEQLKADEDEDAA